MDVEQFAEQLTILRYLIFAAGAFLLVYSIKRARAKGPESQSRLGSKTLVYLVVVAVAIGFLIFSTTGRF